MFSHDKRLQYPAKPSAPDALFATKLQEALGGQWGEMSVMMAYLFQGWNCRGPAKYKDMIMDIATEEIGHVEMLATMISRLLEGAPIATQEAMVANNPAVAAVMGGMNPQAAIVSGLGATPNDSVGFPWTARYIVASGNMLADFRYNVAAESQGRLQVCRLYEMTDDPGVRDTFSFMIARDAMHQNQWLAAIEELERDGLESSPVPSAFPVERQLNEFAFQFIDASAGQESAEGGWASGPSPDRRGEFTWSQIEAMGEAPLDLIADPRLYGTPKSPMTNGATGNGTVTESYVVETRAR